MMTRPLLSLFAVLCGLALPVLSPAAPKRGVWMWSSTTLPDTSASEYGTASIVGDAAFEDETISFLRRHCVQRVYGSYQNRTVTEPAVIAAWNAKLNAAGIDSQMLLAGTDDVEPANRPALLTKVQNRLITFNLSLATPGQRFDGLHLDLEPQQLAAWNAGTPAVKRAYLGMLLDTFTEIRTLLNGAGLSAVPVYADIPFTWDKLPADGGSIGWADAADRDGWYAAAAVPLAGISVMTFSKDNYADLLTAAAYERSGAFLGKARIGIQPLTGPGEMWPDLSAFNAIAAQLEVGTGSVDIENYAFWRHTIATSPPVIALSKNPCGGWLIAHPAKPDAVYRLLGSQDMRRWSEIERIRTLPNVKRPVAEFLVPDEGPRGFWKVEEVAAVPGN